MKNLIQDKPQTDYLKNAIANGVTSVKLQPQIKERNLRKLEYSERTKSEILRLYKLDYELSTIGRLLDVPYYLIYECIHKCTL